MKNIREAIKARKFKVGVIGLGYVGLPLAVEFARGGFETTGFETDAKKAGAVGRGTSYIPDVPSLDVREFSRAGKLKATTDFSGLKRQDAVIICVPTPLRKSKDPDVSYILSAGKEVARNLRKGQIIILESTTYPGTTRELVRPMLEAAGMKAGRDFHLAFSPERVDPGNAEYGVKNTPKIVGGVTPVCTKLAGLLYGQVIDTVVEVSNTDTAELVKLLENTFRAVNIAMINEMSLMCHKLGLNIWEVIAAAASKPFGFMPFYPGPGIGGHCIPLDPQYLGWKMKTLNFEPRFIALAGVINSSMPEHTVSRITELLNDRGRAMKNSKLLIMGMTYKPDISDHRESPAKDVFTLLKKTQAEVDFHDPYVAAIEIEGRTFKGARNALKNLKKYDCVIIITPHSCIDYPALVKGSKLVFDARNAARNIRSPKIHRL